MVRDVTALVLTIGENYTSRAIASVQRQTLPVAETIVIRGVSPFSRAINEGAVQVRTPFFIQVDADMVLDDTCVADLRSCVSEQSGIVVGHLRDPLRGRVPGVKLFRTCCFERVRFRDSVCQDLDFSDEILQRGGWTKTYALKRCGEVPAAWHSFGEHRPHYSPHYTFCKFLVEGARARSRKADGKWLALLHQVRDSTHENAVIAVVGTARGLFVDAEQDLLVPYGPNENADFLERFLQGREVGSEPQMGDRLPGGADLAEGFDRFYEHGIRFRRRHRPATFTRTLQHLLQDGSLAASVALVGLCHGLFFDEYREAEAAAAFTSLAELLPAAEATRRPADQAMTSGEATVR